MGEPASENIRRQIRTTLAAKDTFSHDPPVGHRHHGSRDVFTASFAPDREVAKARFGQVPHPNSIGEQTANISTVSPLPTIDPRSKKLIMHHPGNRSYREPYGERWLQREWSNQSSTETIYDSYR